MMFFASVVGGPATTPHVAMDDCSLTADPIDCKHAITFSCSTDGIEAVFYMSYVFLPISCRSSSFGVVVGVDAATIAVSVAWCAAGIIARMSFVM